MQIRLRYLSLVHRAAGIRTGTIERVFRIMGSRLDLA